MQWRSVYKLRVGVLVACGKLQRAFHAYYANSGLRNQVLFTTTAQPAVLNAVIIVAVRSLAEHFETGGQSKIIL